MPNEDHVEPELAHVPSGADYTTDRAFIDFPLSAEVLLGIHGLGYRVATPVQAAAIEPALAGRDLLVRAKTGTGKTAAFAIPLVERLEEGKRVPKVLILAPTRELAQQIGAEIDGIAAHKDVETVVIVGGMKMGPQEDRLAAGVEIVVGTPGRLLDHARRKNLDLSAVDMVVLDEADEMLSMGFYEDVTNLIEMTADGRQVLLFSATISPDTGRIVARYLQDPLDIKLSTDTDRVEGITHEIYDTTPGQHKVRLLLHILDLEDPDAAIIFCNTREDAATVAAFLDRQGYDAQLLSGELSQSRRNQVVKKIRSGEVRFLVATDVAARGLDLPDITHVFNYALPQDPDVYMHRVGRTGRIGKEGTAVSLVSALDMNTRKVLEGRHQIPFEVKDLPPEEECVRLRVEHQAKQIRKALGSIVFEAYLPTVRALKEHEDGEALLAAALRAFFQWDRQRRAAIAGIVDDDEDDRRGGRKERGGRKDRKRDDGDGKRDRKSSRDRDRDRDDKPRKHKQKEDASDLDALLVAEEGDALLVEDAPSETGGDDDGGAKRKRRRRRKKSKSEGDNDTQASAVDAAGSDDSGPSGNLDDLDALLSAD